MTRPKCSWRDLKVTTAVGGKVSARRARAVLVYWREHSLPPDGFLVIWPTGVHEVDMAGFEEETR